MADLTTRELNVLCAVRDGAVLTTYSPYKYSTGILAHLQAPDGAGKDAPYQAVRRMTDAGLLRYIGETENERGFCSTWGLTDAGLIAVSGRKFDLARFFAPAPVKTQEQKDRAVIVRILNRLSAGAGAHIVHIDDYRGQYRIVKDGDQFTGRWGYMEAVDNDAFALVEPYLDKADDLYPVSPVRWMNAVKAWRIGDAGRAWIDANTRKRKAV